MQTRFVRIVFSSVLTIAAFSTAARADFTNVFSATGLNSQGSNISASATFTLTGNQLSIALANTTANINAVNQVLTGIGFTFSTPGVTTSQLDPLTSPRAGYVCPNTGGCYADPAVTVTTGVGGWGILQGANIANSSGSVGGPGSAVTLSTNLKPDLSGFQWGGGGKRFIANDSIIGKTQGSLRVDDPFLKGPVTFSLTLSGFNDLTRIENVTFLFDTVGQQLVVPEPGFYGVLALGLSGLLVARYRKSAS